MEEQKLKRMEYLGEVIKKYLYTPPELTLKEVAFVLSEEIEDLSLFFEEYKKQLKRK